MTRIAGEAAAMPALADALPPVAVETHVSRIYLVGDLAFKVKKPIATEFLDFSTVELRERACLREVELNRRLAPDVYIGITHLSSDGEPVVVMRRQQAEHCLAHLARSGSDLGGPLLRVVRQLADFHAGAATSRRIAAAGSARRVLARWNDNFAQLGRALPPDADPARVEAIAAAGRRYVGGRARLFRRRIAAGRIRDGHGDLLASDIYCPPTGDVQILDCLEFDDELRHIDALADVAFLAMDLEQSGRVDAAEQLLTIYATETGDDWPHSLADFYIADRAAIRAKVACLRLGDPGAAGDTADLQRHLDVAARRLRQGAVRLVLVGGTPGTGKTSLATSLAARAGWQLHSSDVVRKQLAGASPCAAAAAPYGQGLYTPERTGATYAELLRRAEDDLSLGRSAVLDASWSSPSHRVAARDLADRTRSLLVEVLATVPSPVADERITRRATGPSNSDADVAVAERMRADFAPWPTAAAVDLTRPLTDVASEIVCTVLAEGLDARPATEVGT